MASRDTAKFKQSILEGEQWEYSLWVTDFDCEHIQSTDTDTDPDPESCFESIVSNIDLHVIQSCWMAIRIEILMKIHSSLKHKHSMNNSREFQPSVIPVQHSSFLYYYVGLELRKAEIQGLQNPKPSNPKPLWFKALWETVCGTLEPGLELLNGVNEILSKISPLYRYVAP